MLITFKSKAAGNVLMYQSHAKPLLDLLHKNVNQGVITASETASAITLLETEIANNRAQAISEKLQPGAVAHPGTQDDNHEAVESVSLAARAFPLIEMLRAAQKGGHDVVWGV